MVTKGTLWSVFFSPSRKDNDGIRAFFFDTCVARSGTRLGTVVGGG